MSNVHLTKVPTVGVSYWSGKLPLLEQHCIVNNAQYFDRFYLLTTEELQEDNFPGVIIIQKDDMTEFIKLQAGEDIQSLLPDPFKPNYASDIMTYFPKRILNKLTGESYEAVMYVDTDYFVYSKFLLLELFMEYINRRRIYFINDTNYYYRYPDKEYTNACLSLDCKTEYQDLEAEKVLIRYLALNSSDKSYGVLGPRFTNSIHKDQIGASLRLVPHTFDPRYVIPGLNEESISKGSLGIHLAKSLPKEVGYELVDIMITSKKTLNILVKDYANT